MKSKSKTNKPVSNIGRPMNKRKRKTNKNWEEVPLDETFYTDKEFENLISLEILTDYNITKDGQLHYKVTPQSQESVIPDDVADAPNDEDDTGLPERCSHKPAKANLKRQKEISYNGVEAIQAVEGLAVPSYVDQDPVKRKKANGRKRSAPITNDSPCTTSWTVVDMEDEEIDDAQAHNTNLKNQNAKASKKTPKKVIQSNHSAIIEQLDPIINLSPTFDTSAWSKIGVQEPILKNLSQAGFDKPTPIQALTLGASLLGKKHIVGAAETGSGKTLAFAIPIVQGILLGNNDIGKFEWLQALILTPTRELALQIKKHMDAITKYTRTNVVVIVGGLAEEKQERLLKNRPQVIIATVGRFWEMIQKGTLQASTLSNVRYLAIDETDRMVEKGHFAELEGILELLNSTEDIQDEVKKIKRRQNFVFSATLAFTHEPPNRFRDNCGPSRKRLKKKVTSDQKLAEIMKMIGIVREDAKIVDITSSKGTCETLVEMTLSCQLSQKDSYLYYFTLLHPGRTVVFCNSINCVRRLVNLFYILNLNPIPLHSEMIQKQRLRSLERFGSNERGLLISTDVAARGLDIQNIQHVIHYQVPKTAESYIHRSGRTARAFKGGLALVLIEPSETTVWFSICKSLGRTELLPTFPVDGTIWHQLKSQIELAIRAEQFEHSIRKKSADINWVTKAKKEMDLMSTSDSSDTDDGHTGKERTKKGLKKAKDELTRLKDQLNVLIQGNSQIIHPNHRVQETFKKIISANKAAEEVKVPSVQK